MMQQSASRQLLLVAASRGPNASTQVGEEYRALYAENDSGSVATCDAKDTGTKLGYAAVWGDSKNTKDLGMRIKFAQNSHKDE